MQWLLSFVFVVQMYAMMAIMALFYVPMTLWNDEWAFRGVHAYCAWVRWSARVLVGLRTEVRGTVPTDECLIAAKHQSFLDIILIVSACPRPKFIMKKELTRAPILGWFALKIGCVPVDRGKRSEAVRKMLADVQAGRSRPGQLIIYPQGTRIPPGVKADYKVGTAVLYEALGQRCVPAATNVGYFWPRRGIYRRPGLAVVEFLEEIPPGLPGRTFLARLEEVIETASDRLLAEAMAAGDSK